jgi:hypothetical protein
MSGQADNVVVAKNKVKLLKKSLTALENLLSEVSFRFVPDCPRRRISFFENECFLAAWTIDAPMVGFECLHMTISYHDAIHSLDARVKNGFNT